MVAMATFTQILYKMSAILSIGMSDYATEWNLFEW